LPLQKGYGLHPKGEEGEGGSDSDDDGERPTSGSASQYDANLWQFVQEKHNGKDEGDTYFSSLYEFKNARALYFKLVQYGIFESYADWVGEHCQFTDIHSANRCVEPIVVAIRLRDTVVRRLALLLNLRHTRDTVTTTRSAAVRKLQALLRLLTNPETYL
jgi:hypothetical protein